MLNVLATRLDKGLLSQKYFKAFIFVLCLYPLVMLIYGVTVTPVILGANPAEFIIRYLGDWCVHFLLIGLAITPIRFLTGMNNLIKFRRMIGLFAFFYVCLHLLTYLGFDRVFLWGEIVEDVIKRPFILVGFIAFILLIPLAVTSTRGMVMRLGGKNWNKLHKLVYPTAILGIIHYWWLVKRDVTWVVIYGAMLAVLLLLRFEALKRFLKKHSPFYK